MPTLAKLEQLMVESDDDETVLHIVHMCDIHCTHNSA